MSSCRYLPVNVAESHLVAAKVAGVDSAVFGLKDTPTQTLLFDHPRGNLLVATTKLSHFVTGRYLPTEAWRTIWQTILTRLQPDSGHVELRWTPTVRPSFGPDEPLPADAETQALRRSADWIVASRSLRHADWPAESLNLSLTYNTVRDMPRLDWPRGDGSAGVLEGYSSTIRRDGSQPMRYAVRNDCTTEVAMLLAADAAVNGRSENARRAANLLDYIFDKSGLAGGPRADPQSPSFGLVGWALDHPGSYWGDDNARALLAVGAVAATAGEGRWNEWVARAILANFRTTGVRGFRPSCVEEAGLQAQGWKAYWSSRHVHYSPHMQSWIWACNFWAYQQTRFEPLLVRSKTGMRLMMQAYPARWDWVLRSGTIERSRLLLPLAWLVRVDDTPEHRRWLRQIAEDLIALAGSQRRAARGDRRRRPRHPVERRLRHKRDQPDPDRRRSRLRHALLLQLRPDRSARSGGCDRRLVLRRRRGATGSLPLPHPGPLGSAPGVGRGLVSGVRLSALGLLGQQRRLGVGPLVHGDRLVPAVDRRHVGLAPSADFAVGSCAEGRSQDPL